MARLDVSLDLDYSRVAYCGLCVEEDRSDALALEWFSVVFS